MMMMGKLSFEAEFTALRSLSARIGADPLLVQGAGGNTSIKHDGLLWIKASGKWLAYARSADTFVPVSLDPLLEAVNCAAPSAEKAEIFVDQSRNPSGLRPSIETTVHAIMPQRVVVHVHCVETISLAVRADAEARITSALAGFSHAFLPYARPGLPLARAILDRLKSNTNVLVLGNHGLVVASDSVGGAAELLREVCERLSNPARIPPPHNQQELERLASGSTYRLPSETRAHGTATDPVSLCIASGGSLYPDHVVFLGEGSCVARPGETAASIAAANASPPVSILFPGIGVLMKGDGSPGADAMAKCLADVLARIEEGASLRYLTKAEHGELLNWDAEKYRQQLNGAQGTAR
jgi:rhamnose utilization protein RhaD (predicted bifunctional aldolase and dehydrogenase)